MQKRNILFIGLLAIFAIVIVGSVSAFDLGFLTGDSGPEQVTIEGINFTIPDGYKEDLNNSYDNVTQSASGLSYTMNGKTYANDEGDAIAILIADYGDYNVTDEILEQVSDEPKTINGHAGYIKKDGMFTIFSYEAKGDLVTVTASDETVIDQVIV